MTQTISNQDQIDYWNGAAGQHWVARQEALDVMLAPAAAAAYAGAKIQPGDHVLDVGCGCGGTSIALGELVGPSGKVTGIDISAPMLARAKEQTDARLPVDYVLGDATVHAFAPASFDLLYSRFGVMFFGDPVASFTNLRTGLKPGGRVAFACWRAPRENPWMMLPLQGGYEHLPKPEPVPQDAPGPFSFASEDRVRGILTAAGFQSVGFQPVDLQVDVGAGRGLEAAVTSSIEIGATSRLLQGQSDAIKAAVADSVRRLLAPYQRGDTVPLGAAIWVVTARNA